MAKRSFYSRFAWPILIAHVVLVPLACVAAIRAVKTNRNDVSDWLPHDYPETKQLEWFRDHFVADQFVLISWEGCNLGDDPSGKDDDPRMARLAETLLDVRMIRQEDGEKVPVFTKVTTGRTVLKELMSPPLELGPKTATERLKGGLIGPDGKQTVVVATLTPYAGKHLRQSIGRPVKRFGFMKPPHTPLFEAVTAAGLDENEVRLGGPPVDNNAIDEEGERSLVRLAGLAGLLGLTLAYYSLRSVRMTIVVFTCGVLSAALSLAIVRWTGAYMDAILMSMPALIYVLAVSGAVHITNYYRQSVIHHGFEDAVERGVAHAWKPALLCSVTTGLGLVSLHTSEITPIAKFGDYSAIGVFAMLIILFLFLPATLKLWPWIPPEFKKHRTGGEGTHMESDASRQSGKTWERFGMLVQRHHIAVSLGCFGIIGLLCMGLPRTRTSIDLLKLFSPEAQLLQDYRWFERHLGRIVPMELVIRFPQDTLQEVGVARGLAPGQLVSRHTFLERMEMVAHVQNAIDRELGPGTKLDLVGSTMSATTFAPKFGGPGGQGASRYRYVVNEELSKPENREAFERAGYYRVDNEDKAELWRVSVRVAAFSDIDQGEVVRHIHAAVEPAMQAHAASMAALKSLSQRRDGQPQGAKILYFPGNEGREPSESIADVRPYFAGKNVGIAAPRKSIEDMTAAELEAVKKQFAGVMIGPGIDEGSVARLRAAGVPILSRFDAVEVPEDALGANTVSAVYTGVIPVVYKAQRELLRSLIVSTCWSFSTITPLMMIVCRGVIAGIIMILPNALPVLVVFGGMAWLGIPVDIGSMMAASIALGVAVDDTIHFLAWFTDDYRILGSRSAAVLSAYRRSATATLQAALINGLGLSVFATSSFTPTKRFGWLMLTILIAGMFAELIMCPSLLFGPLGRFFERRKKSPSPAAPIVPPLAGQHERLDNGAPALDAPHPAREVEAARKA